jgi:CRISP-associated protein Cas1
VQRLLNITEQYWTRTYHPPLDPVNAMLSFGYTLLFNNVFSLVLAEGLNPHLGNLHGAERPKAYLAFDLMEEFRSPVVDTLILNVKAAVPTLSAPLQRS